MYRPRNKYFDVFCNIPNLIRKINNKTSFDAYEFMAMRYACCEQIAFLKRNIENYKPGYRWPWAIRLEKKQIKELQSCINKMDEFYNLRGRLGLGRK